MDDNFLYTKAPDTNSGFSTSEVFVNGQFTTIAPSLDLAANSSIKEDDYWRVNGSFSNVCNSNFSMVWKLTSPVCSTRFQTFASFMIVLIVLTVITLLTIIGNSLVILALYQYRSLRTMSNCLIGNLAISDLLLSMTVMPISLGNDLLGYWVFGRTMCTIWLCIDVLYCTASIWGLCTIAFDRYTATVYPVWYHEQKSIRKVVAYVVFVWIFSIIISFAPFIGWQDMIPSFYSYNSNLNRHECILFSTKSYVFYSAMGSFVLPACLMVFLYIRIFSVLHDRSNNLKSRNMSCYTPQSPSIGNGCPRINSPEDNSIEMNLTRENTAFTVTTELMNSTLYLNGNTFTPTSEMIPTEVGNDDQSSDYPSNGDLRSVKPVTETVSFANPDSDGHHLLVTSNPNGDYKRNHNGLRKSCSDAIDLQRQKGDNSCDNSVRSKSVNVLSDLSSDDSDNRCKKTRKHRFSLPWNLSSLERNQRMTLSMKRRFELRETRATKRMLLIMACFFICWIPFLFMYITRSLCEECYMNDHFVAFIIWLGYANSGVNPILYTLFNEDFRRAFKKLLGLSARRKPF
ncbi:octopamine receptor 2-like [Haliotis asinina]|uniref:octopamine receptor 2-like n=1 Tax=Haliotis asinina TaxID=109174 RepID=UPI003532210D